MAKNTAKTKESDAKELSNPFSTGGGGVNFESRIHAVFAIIMLTNGHAPFLSGYEIERILLQGKIEGFETDDIVVFGRHKAVKDRTRKLLVQMKRAPKITKTNNDFTETIKAAWTDFNNPNVFRKKVDVLCLISGPLSTTDTQDARVILEWARAVHTAEQFFRRVQAAKFSSKAKRDKLDVFQSVLKGANNGVMPSDDDIFDFLRHFHIIGYDLDAVSGASSSLVESIICQFPGCDPRQLVALVQSEMQNMNQNAADIRIDSFSQDLRDMLAKPMGAIAEQSELIPPARIEPIEWKTEPARLDYVPAMLLGGWDSTREGDQEAVAKFTGRAISEFETELRRLRLSIGSPLGVQGARWSVDNHEEVFEALSDQILDADLDRFAEIAVEILCEDDPNFDKVDDDSIYERNSGAVRYSRELRKGVANTLALIGSRSDRLTACSANKSDEIVSKVIVRILYDAPPARWAALKYECSLLAEAAPQTFLNAVESGLSAQNSPFVVLFERESSGIFGENHLLGVLWALETLSWSDDLLIRSSLALARLVKIDPGGNWANRPLESLHSIYLPWFPQTLADPEKRKEALENIRVSQPNIIWQVLRGLFPRQKAATSGTHKPIYRWKEAAEYSPKVTGDEYWSQVEFVFQMAIEVAHLDFDKLAEICGELDEMPPSILDEFLNILASTDVAGAPEDSRTALWRALKRFVDKHRKFADAKWSMSEDQLTPIEKAAESLRPQGLVNRYAYLFTDRESELYEGKGNYREQHDRLEERRRQALTEILEAEGLQGLLVLVQSVDSPRPVGNSLGTIGREDIDPSILPEYLNPENDKIYQFALSYCFSRYWHGGGIEWLGSLELSSWDSEQVVSLACNLPFVRHVWRFMHDNFRSLLDSFWRRVVVNPYTEDGDLSEAVRNLNAVGRAGDSVECLYKMLHDGIGIDPILCIGTLDSLLAHQDSLRHNDENYIRELIIWLQKAEDVSDDEKVRIEWAYHKMLTRFDGGQPVFLWRKLETRKNWSGFVPPVMIGPSPAS